MLRPRQQSRRPLALAQGRSTPAPRARAGPRRRRRAAGCGARRPRARGPPARWWPQAQTRAPPAPAPPAPRACCCTTQCPAPCAALTCMAPQRWCGCRRSRSAASARYSTTITSQRRHGPAVTRGALGHAEHEGDHARPLNGRRAAVRTQQRIATDARHRVLLYGQQLVLACRGVWWRWGGKGGGRAAGLLPAPRPRL